MNDPYSPTNDMHESRMDSGRRLQILSRASMISCYTHIKPKSFKSISKQPIISETRAFERSCCQSQTPNCLFIQISANYSEASLTRSVIDKGYLIQAHVNEVQLQPAVKLKTASHITSQRQISFSIQKGEIDNIQQS